MAKRGEKISELGALLSGMSPKLAGGRYFIATVDEGQLMALANYVDYLICIFKEEEGLTLVFQEDVLEEMQELTEKDTAGPFALITLTVNSDLMAIGFLAKLAEALAKEKISVNAFSAYYHDHLLVPYERKEDAMRALAALSKSAGK
jgi:hypothetical protein